MSSRITDIFTDDLSFLNEDEKSKFRHICYAKGNIIYAQKYKFLVILNGQGKINYYDEHGREFILSYANKGSYIILDKFSSFEITQNCEVLEISIREIFELMSNSKFANSIINAFLKNITMHRDLIKNLVFENIETRTLNFLHQNSQNGLIYIKHGVTEISNFIGAPRQNVSSAIAKLVKNGKIKKIDNNTFEIL